MPIDCGARSITILAGEEMYLNMENNPLDNLPPETRQRVENALQALGGGTPPQNVFVTQYPGEIMGHMLQETRQYAEEAFDSRQKKQIGHDQAWAHWEYDSAEWALFDKIDWEPLRNKSRLTLILGPILYLVIIGVLLAIVWIISHSLPAVLAIVLAPAIILLTALMFPMLSATASIREAKKRYQARQNPAEPHRITFSWGGVWESGTYFPLNAGRLELESVKMTASPAVLHFKMLKRNQDGSWTGTAQKIHVIVPHGYEEEAEQLRQRYYADVIKSWKKPIHPPEPN
jgi:hypothetical protein